MYLGLIHSNDEYNEAECGIYWNTSRRIIMGIHLLDSVVPKDEDHPITIIMNSDGGYWEYGMAIYDAIRQSSNTVVIINMSTARSMTSIIYQAADLRITAPSGYYMIHDGTLGVEGIPKSVQNVVAFDKKQTRKIMYQIYLDRLQETVDKTPIVDIKVAADILNSKFPEGARKVSIPRGIKGITLEHIAQLCGQDTFFDADQMIALNFADRKLATNDLMGSYVNPSMENLPTGLHSFNEE